MHQSWEVYRAGWAEVEEQALQGCAPELSHRPQGISEAANSPHPQLRYPHQASEVGLVVFIPTL